MSIADKKKSYCRGDGMRPAFMIVRELMYAFSPSSITLSSSGYMKVKSKILMSNF